MIMSALNLTQKSVFLTELSARHVKLSEFLHDYMFALKTSFRCKE